MTRFHIVVAEGLGIVLQVVDDLCSDVGFVSLDVVGIIAGGLSLQNVAIVQQNQAVAVGLALALEVGADTRHRSLHRAALREVIWEESPVDVRGFYQSDGYSLALLGHSCHADAQECKKDSCFFHSAFF